MADEEKRLKTALRDRLWAIYKARVRQFRTSELVDNKKNTKDATPAKVSEYEME